MKLSRRPHAFQVTDRVGKQLCILQWPNNIIMHQTQFIFGLCDKTDISNKTTCTFIFMLFIIYPLKINFVVMLKKTALTKRICTHIKSMSASLLAATHKLTSRSFLLCSTL